ncbi:MAG: glycosyltransferase family 39 protein, partial [bacterium]
MTAPLLLGWNAWLLFTWVTRFHVIPADLRRAFVGFFLERSFSWLTFAGNWSGFLSSAAALAGLLAVTVRLGRRANALVWPGRDPVREIVFGLGWLGSAVLGLGLCGLLVAPPHAVSVPLLGGFGAWELWRNRRGAARRLRAARAGLRLRELAWPVRACLVALAVVTVAEVLSIETGWDAMTYHLRLPTYWLYRHKFFDVWHNIHGTYLLHNEMLFTAAMALGGDTLARLLNAAVAVLLVAAAVRLGRTLGARGPWTGLLLAGSPLFVLQATRNYTELELALFGACAWLALAAWWRTGSRRALVAAGLCAGWTVAGKYPAVLLVPAVAAVVVTAPRGRLRPRAVLAWGAAALLPLAPWLVRHWLRRGNPPY